MLKTNFPRWAGIVTALVAVLMFATPARAQAPPPPEPTAVGSSLPNAGACAAPMDGSIWLGFCSPAWLLPIGAPEIAFGGSAFNGSGIISYEATSRIMTISSKITGIYFDTHGNAEPNIAFNDPARSAASTVMLRVVMGNDGKFVSGAGNACGDGGFDDFCIIGEVHSLTAIYGRNADGTLRPLIRGRVEHATNKPNAVSHDTVLWDDFEYHVKLTGGDIYDAFWAVNGFDHVVVENFGYNNGNVTYVGDNPFTASFAEQFMFGFTGVTANDVGMLFDPCNGRISGSVTDYFNGTGIAGAEVAITGQPNAPTNSTTGAYSTAGALCQGSYTVNALNPGTYTFSGSDTALVNIGPGSGGQNTIVSSVNFRMYASAVSSSAYTTFNQASWGTKPRGQNAGAILKTYFPYLYPDGVEVGVPGTGGFSLTQTTSGYVADILPQEGRPVPLSADFVDNAGLLLAQHRGKLKHHRRLGSLAGEVLALELNVRFSQWALTRSGLGDLKVASGPLAGRTVNQILAWGNQMLGGQLLPSAIGLKNYDALEDIIERINKNFQAGTTDNHYLIP